MFTDRLRSSTQAIHEIVENSNFMKDLLSGSLQKSRYVLYLIALWPIYNSLESELSFRKSNLITSFYDKRLNRKDRVYDNIALLKSDEKINDELLKEVNFYAYQIQKSSDIQLIANQYIRYMGDMAGGQAIKSIMKRSYNFADEELSFYDFDIEEGIKKYRDSYKDKINRLIATEEDQNEFVSSVLDAYESMYKILKLI
jgi:heme oxygenase